MLATAIRTAIVQVVLLAGIRLLGKRHVGEMRIDDILLVLLAANAVQNAMTKGSPDLAVALVAASTLIATGWLAAVVFRRSQTLERWISGTPTVLVHEGVVLTQNLRREQLTREQLMMAMRKEGLTGLSDVKLAVLEVNGAISIVPREQERPGGGG